MAPCLWSGWKKISGFKPSFGRRPSRPAFTAAISSLRTSRGMRPRATRYALALICSTFGPIVLLSISALLSVVVLPSTSRSWQHAICCAIANWVSLAIALRIAFCYCSFHGCENLLPDDRHGNRRGSLQGGRDESRLLPSDRLRPPQ